MMTTRDGVLTVRWRDMTVKKRIEWTGLGIAALVGAGLLIAPQIVPTAVEAATVHETSEVTHSSAYQVSSITSNDVGLMTSTDTETYDAGSYSLMRADLHSGKASNIRWNPCQRVVSYRVNLVGLPESEHKEMLRTIMESFKKLHAATGIIYRYRGDTDFVPQKDTIQQQPAEIVVAVVKPQSDTDFQMEEDYPAWGGVLWTSWFDNDEEGAAAVRGQVLLDATRIENLAEGFGAGLTRGNVVLHELGHVTGLGDAKKKGELMYPVLSKSTPDGFAAGDLEGLEEVGKQAGCISIPSYVKVGDLS
ncbi:matrixin family metalloprotease [Kineosporia sp. J2-2]|uniref:Matrixin family metalloprotease n=1 Tax=Kineosporia corallincola TaxID=2835133 RepID=A0ABS5THD8_9ACTN|nr:matrixin family metalloprotease [Kineosporia corallincola]MBT0769014.1 matrixin family metalloprotease [Kineosporia corallincola]